MRVKLRIDDLAVGGDGVAHLDLRGERRAVFVPQVAPGELVEASIDDSTRPARGAVLRVLEPSPSRRSPPCPHFDRCGGCPWMFLDAAGQRAARSGVLAATLGRALGSALVPISLHEAPAGLAYRGRARLAVSARGSVSLGYRGARSRKVTPIDQCGVLVPALDALLPRLRAWLAGARGEGEASVALGAKGLPVIALSWERGDLPGSLFGALERAVASGELAGASVQVEGARQAAVVGDPTAWVAGPDGLPLEVAGFAQANDAVTHAMAARLRELVGEGRPSIVELYAGAGTFTVVLAAQNTTYTSVESERGSCEAARRNLARRGLSWVKVIEVDASAWVIPPRTSLVVLDPPRTGAREACSALAASRVDELIYVSCDPTTLSRDLVTLVGAGFAVQSLDAFDMFPQTSHTEVVAHLKRG